MLCVAHFAANPLIVTYAEYLGAGVRLAGLLAGMFFGVALIFRPIVGPAMTKLDKRKLLVYVFILGAIANLGYALFHNITAFVLFRFLSGVQFSFVGALLMSLAADHLPGKKLAAGMGVFGTGASVGNAVGTTIGEAIFRAGTNARSEGHGFTLMFLFGAIILALSIIPTLLMTPDKKKKEDIASAGAWYKNIFTINALPTTIVMLFTTIPFAMIFVYMLEFGWERNIAGINLFFPVLAGALALTRPIGGYLIYKFGIAPVIYPALTLFAISLLVIGSSHTLTMLLIGAVLAAIGSGFSQPTLQAMCMQTETPLRRGVAANTAFTAIDTGLFLGPVIGGLVRYQAGFAVMFRTSAIPIGIAIICLIVIMPIHKRRVEEMERTYNQDT